MPWQNSARFVFAAVVALFLRNAAGEIPTCTCGNPGKTSGTTAILLYADSQSCKGTNVKRTVRGPPITNGKHTYSECFVADAFRSFQLKNTSQYIANYCRVYTYPNESCGGAYLIYEYYAGVCDESEVGKSFQIDCYKA